MMVEAERLLALGVADVMARTLISADALVVTPFERAANRLRELARGNGRHGSCGLGIGETQSDLQLFGESVVRVRDLLRSNVLRRKLRWLQSRKRHQLFDVIQHCRGWPAAAPEIAVLEDEHIVDTFMNFLTPFLAAAQIREDECLGRILREPGDVVFEGAQGVLIDEWRGFDPYTTWSTCTFDNALALLVEHDYTGELTKLGVVRAYATRHGPGPFPTENAALTAVLPDSHNGMNDWQREFRVGWFDAVMTRYAIAACSGVDAVAVTCLDRLQNLPTWFWCDDYDLSAGCNDPTFFERSTFAQGQCSCTNIRLGPTHDLSYQEALTKQLFSVKPMYCRLADVETSFEIAALWYLAEMANSLGVPVRIASFGPKATDKRFYE
jgi:adenylosuccinate synthase